MPERVTCDDCGAVSAPMFWIGESIYCRPHVRERVDDFRWPDNHESVPDGRPPEARRLDRGLEQLAECVAAATSTPRGLDHYAVDVRDLHPVEWAEMTDRDESTIYRNLSEGDDDAGE